MTESFDDDDLFAVRPAPSTPRETIGRTLFERMSDAMVEPPTADPPAPPLPPRRTRRVDPAPAPAPAPRRETFRSSAPAPRYAQARLGAGPTWKPDQCADCGRPHPCLNRDGGKPGTPWRCSTCDRTASPMPPENLLGD